MVRNLCCVKDCKSTKQQNPELHFHNLPLKEPDRLKKWIEFCENQTLTDLYKTNDPRLYFKSICSQHFEDNKYNNPIKKIRLMVNALPTIKTKDVIHQKKSTNDSKKSQPNIQVIPTELLLRTNCYSQSWRPSPVTTGYAKTIATEVSAQSTGCRPIVSAVTEPKVNPIVRNLSAQHFRHIEEVRNLRQKLSKARKQVMNLKYRLKRANPIGNTRKSKLNYILKCINGSDCEALNPLMSEIIGHHLISAFSNKPRVPKWTNRIKKFCADLFHKSPTAYTFLQKTMSLPTKKTVMKFIEDRIQIAKNETFKQNNCLQKNKPIDSDLNQIEDQISGNQMINCDQIDDQMGDLLSNDIIDNFSVEYDNRYQKRQTITITTTDNTLNCDQTNSSLSTQITLAEEFISNVTND